MNPICFYHKADLDGVCSGAIVKHFVPDVELVGFDYGMEFPWDKVYPDGRNGLKHTVFMVDVSLPPADMKRLNEVADLVWIDHHKTAIAAIQPRLPGLQIVGYAGCELAWLAFSALAAGDTYPHLFDNLLAKYGSTIPEAVRLLGRYDVWDKDNPDWASRILPFQYGVRTTKGIYDPTCDMWGMLCWDCQPEMVLHDIMSLIGIGSAILSYQAEVNRQACESGAHVELLFFPNPPADGQQALRILACNTIIFNSQFFEAAYDEAKHDVMCAYCRLKDGRWRVSLYGTKPEIDCGAICKTFGGGGHKEAAGFLCDQLPWA